MTYQQVLEYLLQQLPMFQRMGAAAYRNNLDNITALCNLMDNPQQGLKCIHVAGTNGKGSVTHIIASVLQQQGYKVGVFVSPHYKDYRERIKINGKLISRQFVTKFVVQNKEKFAHINASFFEISTVMAFEYFKQQQVDYAVIETGMGGRLDSTNVITPLLSVITNISYDHTQFLGNTLAKIAGEKAGIIKPNTPVVIGETQLETKPVFLKVAKRNKAEIHFADKMRFAKYNSDLHGTYQQRNIRTALAAIKVLKGQGINITERALKSGLLHVRSNTNFIGRWMVVSKKPTVVFDSAHNEGGLKQLVKQLRITKYNKLHIVYGTVGDKDISKNLSVLPQKATYYFCNADMPRALSADELAEQAAKYKLKGKSYKTVRQAFKAAKLNAQSSDMVLVSGSVFVVAEVL